MDGRTDGRKERREKGRKEGKGKNKHVNRQMDTGDGTSLIQTHFRLLPRKSGEGMQTGFPAPV